MVDIVLPVSLVLGSTDVVFDTVAIFLGRVFVPLAGVAGAIFVDVEGSLDEIVVFKVAEAVVFAVLAD